MLFVQKLLTDISEAVVSCLSARSVDSAETAVDEDSIEIVAGCLSEISACSSVSGLAAETCSSC